MKTARLWIGGAALLLSSIAAAAQPCAPAGDDICQAMASQEFKSAYREFSDSSRDPQTAIEYIRFNLTNFASGAGKASPAAIGLQLDAALELVLSRIKRDSCRTGSAQAPSAETVARALSQGGHQLGITLTPSSLGGLTGIFVSALSDRKPGCVCGAVQIDDLPRACAALRSR